MTRAWLVLTKTDQTGGRGGHEYDDDPSSHYASDSRVANARHIRRGDALVVWDQTQLLGASVVERVEMGEEQKDLKKCPYCGPGRSLDERVTKLPRYRCGNCKREFDKPAIETVRVKTYRTHHNEAWIDLAGELSGATLRSLCEKPGSQHSIRPLKWAAFAAALGTDLGMRGLTLMDSVSVQLSGGFGERITRVRLGQPSFRAHLLDRYSSNCAFSGSMPQEVLEAAHLYSYAEVGDHHDEGGLLLRRDLHRLFDLGKIAVRDNSRIIVHNSLQPFPLYKELDGRPLKVDVTKRQREWFASHRDMWNVGAA
ncbi:hypothetical protein ASG56_10580 [Rhodococcus sp. Leaf7]|nr:hypothetical protein ASG56_10580 [Rhodococcus sp. Leaf7]KQU40904.1 hypothetical protein ASG64_10575 [Rhodococcus sp. Leaf247]